MSEELRRGIPKAIVIGKRERTKEEEEKSNREFERILKRKGVLGKDDHIEDYIVKPEDYDKIFNKTKNHE